jgi:hypothetical protein
MSDLADLKAQVGATINLADERRYFGASVKYQRALEAEVERLRDAFDRFLTACANREHEGMPRDEWEAEFLAAEEALGGDESPPRDG